LARLLFSSAAFPNHHVQDALLWVELNSFWFYGCHLSASPFPLSLCLSMLRYDSIHFKAISGYLIIHEKKAECLVGQTGING
jgi:hypothetical protein